MLKIFSKVVRYSFDGVLPPRFGYKPFTYLTYYKKRLVTKETVWVQSKNDFNKLLIHWNHSKNWQYQAVSP